MKNILAKHIYKINIVFIFSIVTSCISYKPVQLKEIKKVELINNDITAGEFKLALRIANPNGYAIKIKKYDLHAFVNNVDLGQIGVNEKIILKSGTEEDYTISFKADGSKLMGLIPTMMMAGSGEAGLRGTIKAKALLFSKTFPVDLKKRVSINDFR